MSDFFSRILIYPLDTDLVKTFWKIWKNEISGVVCGRDDTSRIIVSPKYLVRPRAICKHGSLREIAILCSYE